MAAALLESIFGFGFGLLFVDRTKLKLGFGMGNTPLDLIGFLFFADYARLEVRHSTCRTLRIVSLYP